jgi:Flp pilus assembly protein TadD
MKSDIRIKRTPRLKARLAVLSLLLVISFGRTASAGDMELRIKLPKRSSLTPVQRLNREGVEAIQKNKFDKAKELFYKAYLYDPGDPFTLNNLGYIAELEGQVERAQTFYSLASGLPTEAAIDRASSSKLKGQPLQTALNSIHDVAMQINRANVAAVRLLSEGRVSEADSLLHRTLALDPKNPFTLNNLGVAREAQGEYGEALRYYTSVADAHVDEAVVVTMNGGWRGKSVSEMAAASAKRLTARMNDLQTQEAQAILFNARGVSAMNRNDWQGAWQNFSRAYKLSPTDAFSLNNQGYMAELGGDLETAQEFYREAQRAGGSITRIGLATRRDAEGYRLYTVANESEAGVSDSIETASQARRRNAAPIQLKRRDGTPVTAPATTPQP